MKAAVIVALLALTAVVVQAQEEDFCNNIWDCKACQETTECHSCGDPTGWGKQCVSTATACADVGTTAGDGTSGDASASAWVEFTDGFCGCNNIYSCGECADTDGCRYIGFCVSEEDAWYTPSDYPTQDCTCEHAQCSECGSLDGCTWCGTDGGQGSCVSSEPDSTNPDASVCPDGLFEGATCPCWDNHNCDSCAARDDCSWCGIENFCSSNDPDFGGGCYGFPEVTTVEECLDPSPCHYIYGDCETCFAAGCSWCETTGGVGTAGGGEFGHNFGYCSSPEVCFAGDQLAATCPCDQNYDCESCTSEAGCGWCGDNGDNGSCHPEGSDGCWESPSGTLKFETAQCPVDDECSHYSFDCEYCNSMAGCEFCTSDGGIGACVSEDTMGGVAGGNCPSDFVFADVCPFNCHELQDCNDCMAHPECSFCGYHGGSAGDPTIGLWGYCDNFCNPDYYFDFADPDYDLSCPPECNGYNCGDCAEVDGCSWCQEFSADGFASGGFCSPADTCPIGDTTAMGTAGSDWFYVEIEVEVDCPSTYCADTYVTCDGCSSDPECVYCGDGEYGMCTNAAGPGDADFGAECEVYGLPNFDGECNTQCWTLPDCGSCGDVDGCHWCGGEYGYCASTVGLTDEGKCPAGVTSDPATGDVMGVGTDPIDDRADCPVRCSELQHSCAECSMADGCSYCYHPYSGYGECLSDANSNWCLDYPWSIEVTANGNVEVNTPDVSVTGEADLDVYLYEKAYLIRDGGRCPAPSCTGKYDCESCTQGVNCVFCEYGFGEGSCTDSFYFEDGMCEGGVTYAQAPGNAATCEAPSECPYLSCDECAASVECGWCASSQICMPTTSDFCALAHPNEENPMAPGEALQVGSQVQCPVDCWQFETCDECSDHDECSFCFDGAYGYCVWANDPWLAAEGGYNDGCWESTINIDSADCEVTDPTDCMEAWDCGTCGDIDGCAWCMSDYGWGHCVADDESITDQLCAAVADPSDPDACEALRPCWEASNCGDCSEMDNCGWCGGTHGYCMSDMEECWMWVPEASAAGECSYDGVSVRTELVVDADTCPPPDPECWRNYDCGSCSNDDNCAWCGSADGYGHGYCSSISQANTYCTAGCGFAVIEDDSVCPETCYDRDCETCSDGTADTPCQWCEDSWGHGYCQPSGIVYHDDAGVGVTTGSDPTSWLDGDAFIGWTCSAEPTCFVDPCPDHDSCGSCADDDACTWCSFGSDGDGACVHASRDNACYGTAINDEAQCDAVSCWEHTSCVDCASDDTCVFSLFGCMDRDFYADEASGLTCSFDTPDSCESSCDETFFDMVATVGDVHGFISLFFTSFDPSFGGAITADGSADFILNMAFTQSEIEFGMTAYAQYPGVSSWYYFFAPGDDAPRARSYAKRELRDTEEAAFVGFFFVAHGPYRLASNPNGCGQQCLDDIASRLLPIRDVSITSAARDPFGEPRFASTFATSVSSNGFAAECQFASDGSGDPLDAVCDFLLNDLDYSSVSTTGATGAGNRLGWVLQAMVASSGEVSVAHDTDAGLWTVVYGAGSFSFVDSWTDAAGNVNPITVSGPSTCSATVATDASDVETGCLTFSFQANRPTSVALRASASISDDSVVDGDTLAALNTGDASDNTGPGDCVGDDCTTDAAEFPTAAVVGGSVGGVVLVGAAVAGAVALKKKGGSGGGSAAPAAPEDAEQAAPSLSTVASDDSSDSSASSASSATSATASST